MHAAISLPAVDVLIVGGGPAGAVAAVASARAGLTVALVEQRGFLGGNSTAVLDSFYGFYTPEDPPQKVVFGIPDEVVDRLAATESTYWRPNQHGGGIGIGYDPERLKEVWDSLLLEAGVAIYFNSTVCAVEATADTVTEIAFIHAGGTYAIAARYFIDCSGDAALCALAGSEFLPEGVERPQSLSTTIRLANVDTERARSFPLLDMAEMIREARESGEFDLPHDDVNVHRATFPGGALGIVTRVDADALSPVERSKAEINGRRQAREYMRFLQRRVPGYEHAVIVAFSSSIGVRRSRRIRGEAVLSLDDLKSGRRWDDAVARSGSPMELQAGSGGKWEYLPRGVVYDIPLRALMPVGLTNVLAAGRCLSADERAHASARLMAQCMAMGEGAGVAVAIASRDEANLRSVEGPLLRTDGSST